MIYLVTNLINGKRYIGKTAQTLEKRWYQHCKNAEYGHDTYLYRSMRKYGISNFMVEKLCEGLDDEEIKMIDIHGPEYNMTRGGDGGDTSESPAYIQAIAKRNTSGTKNPMYGKVGALSPNFGKKKTEEQKQNHRNGYKGKRISVVIDGVHYESVARAAKELGRSERYVRLHDEINEWKY